MAASAAINGAMVMPNFPRAMMIANPRMVTLAAAAVYFDRVHRILSSQRTP